MHRLFRLAPAVLLAGFAVRLAAAQQTPVVQAQVVAPSAVSPVRATPLLDSARAALTAGQTEPAVRMAEQYTARNYRDPRGFVVLGNAYFNRMPAGRFQALRAYEEAQRLAPTDPEPANLYAQVGIFLGGDDGEAIARRGLEKVIELVPMYGMAWSQWLLVFRNSGSRHAMRQRLARHAENPEVRARIAYLHIEDEQYQEADSILDRLLADDSTNVEWLAWRAQSAFEAGDTTSGTDYYVRALTNADHDSSEALWRQAVGIARPDEVRAWGRVPPERRGAWLATFWARRSGNLFGGTNTRLAEHFRRLRHARRTWPLLHPLVTYQRSQLSRSMNLEPARGERDFYQRCEMYEVLVPPSALGYRPLAADAGEAVRGGVGAYENERAVLAGAPQGIAHARDLARMSPGPFNTFTDDEAAARNVSFFERTIFVPLNMDLRGVDTTAARIGYNLATGLEDRGILYLRFGPPQTLAMGGTNDAAPTCTTRDVERWRYDALGDIRFSRPSAFARDERTVSEMVFRSMNQDQFEAMRAALTSDAPAEPATLAFGVWTAQFAGGRPGSTEIAVISTRGALAATLVSNDGVSDVRRGVGGWVMLETDPGDYTLLAHARDSSALGRIELNVKARQFALPSISDLLLAPSWPLAGPTRYDMLRHVGRSLSFAENTTMRSYAELYGLQSDGGLVRYRAEYSLLRSAHPARDMARDVWPDAVRLAFDRESPQMASGITREILDITPEQLGAGSYVLRLRVWDLIAGKEVGGTQVTFTVR